MPLLGLLDSEKFASQRFTNIRRSVFYFYPNGAAPLIGLLSLLDTEVTNDPKFSWFEKRMDDQRTTTAANTTGALVVQATNADYADPTGVIADQTVVRLCLTDASRFRVGHQIKLTAWPLNAGGTQDLFGRVEAVFSGTTTGSTYYTGTKQGIDIRVTGAWPSLHNTAATVGLETWVVGNVFAQGAVGPQVSVYNLPANIPNNTQIFRTPFSFTGTALKTALKFDETGPYADRSKEASIQHMTEMEKAYIFGQQKVATNPTSGLPEYYTGGVLWFLAQWELNSANPYAPFGGATSDSDDNKRIIANSTGVLSEKTYDTYLERVFRITNNKTNEKLVLCGSGALLTINQMYRNRTVLQLQQGTRETTYGMSVVSHITPFGTIHYRSHPLFSQNPTMRFNMLFLDVHNLKYRYVTGRDTDVLKNRQPNNADYREDEWMTESGLELRFPESCLYLQNVAGYAP